VQGIHSDDFRLKQPNHIYINYKSPAPSRQGIMGFSPVLSTISSHRHQVGQLLWTPVLQRNSFLPKLKWRLRSHHVRGGAYEEGRVVHAGCSFSCGLSPYRCVPSEVSAVNGVVYDKSGGIINGGHRRITLAPCAAGFPRARPQTTWVYNFSVRSR